MQEKNYLDNQNHLNSRLSMFVENFERPKEIVAKNKSGNTDSTNNSLVHPEETFDNETL